MNKPKNIRRRVNTPTAEPLTTYPLLPQTDTSQDSPKGEGVLVHRGKIKWYWAPGFLFLWIFLYFFISIPAYHRLPKPLSIKDEPSHPDRFIAERAEIYLRKLCELGPRVVGSEINERLAVKYFMRGVLQLRTDSMKNARSGSNELEIDIQIVSGSYVHWDMVNMYQGVQNIVVKVSPKNTNSSSYLLVNSHFDTVPGGTGAGDDGAMVAIMLETIRVLMKSNKPLKHPVVFLFNGAEENPLQASHGFITKHKWAKNVKALINLDSAGSGGREILFQSGPNHPWLMRHYSRAIWYPYASTVAEEMFQRHLIPSDTDFRIFRDHGKVPGLDMAHQYNGYVYHTKFDLPDIIPRGTLQNTGDNVLALVREIANAPELTDPSQFSEGHTIFFDVMGMFLVFYSETDGIIINLLTSLAGIIACLMSFRMMATQCGMKISTILRMHALYTFGVQVVAVIAGVLLCFAVAVFMDLAHMPMSWFTHSWLIFGQYFCPLFFGMAIVPAIYFQSTKNDRFPLGYRVQILLHSHCLFLCAMTIIATMCNVRSTFMLMIAVLFYTTALIINLTTKLHNKPLLWLVPHILFGIPPFLFYAYLSHGFFVAFIPMTGRFGASVNPDLIICAFSVGVGILTGGFMIPILNLFHKSKTFICSLLIIMFIFIVLAMTPLGFPYRPATNVQRFSVLHARRVFHDTNNALRRIETGYFIMPQDRRTYSVKGSVINASLAQSIGKDCEEEMFCGLPLYNHRWQNARAQSLWIPGPDPQFDKLPELILKTKNKLSPTKWRYEMQLTGPDHMGLFIRPRQEAKIVAWSFHRTPLRMNWEAPYFIYFSYGVDNSPLNFWMEFEKTNEVLKEPIVEIGIAGHWTHQEHMLTPDFKKFLASFPNYVDTSAWPAIYVTWNF